MTTLRNIVGGMTLEQTLTSREEINRGLSVVLDEATGRWGIRVGRVEIKGIDPPPSIKDSMEKQMRADRDKRAVILTAEGQRQSAILTAEGNKQAAILNAEGDREALILRAQANREAAILKAQGEGQAIQTVFQAIHDGQPDQALLAYQYLQMMPKIAEGSANKVWVVPSEITKALEGLGSAVHEVAGIPHKVDGPRVRVDIPTIDPSTAPDSTLSSAHEEVQRAIAAAEESARAVSGTDPSAAPQTPPATVRVTPQERRPPAGEPLEIVAILLAGVAAGTINTVVGSGTLITFPTLLAFGIPPVTANVSNTLGLVPGSLSGAIGYRAELGANGPAAPAGERLAPRRRRGSPAAAPAALRGLRRDRAGADPARLRPGGARAADPAAGDGPCRGTRWRGRARRLVGVAGRPGRGRVRRLLRRRAGRAADGDPRHRRRRLDAAAQRHQERARADRQRRRGDRLHRARARRRPGLSGGHIDWPVVLLIAVGSIIGGQLGATVGRRFSPNVLAP